MNTFIKDPKRPSKGSQVLLAATLVYVAAGFILKYVRISAPAMLVISQSLILGCGLIGVWRCGYDSEIDLRILPVDGYNLLLVFFTMICCYPITAFLNLVSMQFVPNAVAEVSPQVFAYGLGPSILLMALFPAIGEELLMRGIVYRSYKKVSPVAAMLLTALLFGMMHMNFNQMPYAMFLGIVMVLINEAADSMVMSMVLHFLFNAGSTALNYYSSRLVNDEVMDEAMEMVSHADQTILLTYGILAVVMLFLLIVVIRAMYRYNHRTLTAAFRKDDYQNYTESSDTEKTMEALSLAGQKKMKIMDLWFVAELLLLLLCMLRSVI